MYNVQYVRIKNDLHYNHLKKNSPFSPNSVLVRVEILKYM